MPLDIAFFGSSLVSAYWNGAATYYRGIIRALARRGHRVTFYEPDAYGRQEHRDIADPPWARVVVYESQGSEGVERALESARSADLLVKASGIGVFDPLLERAIATGQDWRELADREIQLFREDMQALRVLPPTAYVGAVESIPVVLELIEQLQSRGVVYDVEGDLYFSVHADGGEVVAWLGRAPRPPRVVYVVHGEPRSSAALARRISDELGWNAVVPRYGERVRLD